MIGFKEVRGMNVFEGFPGAVALRVALEKITGYVTHIGCGYGLPWVWVWVGIFPPAKNPYPWGRLRGLGALHSSPPPPPPPPLPPLPPTSEAQKTHSVH